MQVTSFYERYGNINDFMSSQYFNALDRNGMFLATPNTAVLGKSFYDKEVQ
jgi:hypothetical protein